MDKNVGQFALALSNLVKLVGVLMLTYGLSAKYATLYFWLGVVGGGAGIVIPALYDVVILGRAVLKSFAVGTAVGAEAGIKMTLAEKALDRDDNVISMANAKPGDTPPKAVTMEKGLEIAKAFGPEPSEVKTS